MSLFNNLFLFFKTLSGFIDDENLEVDIEKLLRNKEKTSGSI